MAHPKPLRPATSVPPPTRPTNIVAYTPRYAFNSGSHTGGSANGNRIELPYLYSEAWFSEATSLDAPVRVSLNESIGGVFVDARIEVTTLPTYRPALGGTLAIGDELSPDPHYAARIVAHRRSADLNVLEGETILSQLHRVPANITIELIPGENGAPDPLTPQIVLEHILTQYNIPHDPVPRLLLRTAGEELELHLSGFVYQPDEQPITIGEFLESFLQPFTGYAVRARQGTVLEVVSPFGEAALSITHNDLGLLVDETLDSSEIVNACEVTISGWDFVDDTQFLEPAWLGMRAGEARWALHGFTIPRQPKPDPPDNYRELFNHRTADSYNLGSYGSGYPTFTMSGSWPVAGGVVQQPGANIRIVGTVVIKTRVVSSGVPGSVGDVTINIDKEVPASGATVTLWSSSQLPVLPQTVTGIDPGSASIKAAWDPEEKTVRLTVTTQPYCWARHGIPTAVYNYAIEFTGNGLTRAWAKKGTEIARFGYETHEQITIPGLTQSHDLYELREAKHDLGWFHVDLADALRIARGIVEHNYNPRTERRFQITPNPNGGGYRIRANHLNRQLNLPDGTTGVITSWQYDEAHTPGASTSNVTITVTETAPLARNRARRTHYGRAAYRIGRYGENRV